MNVDKLKRAIELFEDETSDMTFSQRISELRNAFMWNVFYTIKKIKKYGKKADISEDAIYIQEEGIKQFHLLEKLYFAELKAAARTGKSEKDVDQEWLKRIRESPSSLGSIVRSMSKETEEVKTG